MGNLAHTYSDLGRNVDAVALFQQLLEFQRRVLPANHPDIGEGCLGGMGCMWCDDQYFPPSGSALFNISYCYEKSGLLPRALECAREALRIWQVSLPPGHEHIALAQSLLRRLERALQ